MTYAKPELVALTHAVRAIQMHLDKRDVFLDAIDPNRCDATCNAYEADE